MSDKHGAIRVAARPGALSEPNGHGPACAGFAELGLIHWVAGDSLARVSARAQRLLGGLGARSLVSLDQLWAAADPIDRVALSRAASAIRPASEPLRLRVRIVGAGAAADSVISVAFEAIAHASDGESAQAGDGGRWDVYAVLMPVGTQPAVRGGPLLCYDGLTGQPNRLQFRDQVHHALRRAARDQSLLAVLSIEAALPDGRNAANCRALDERALRAVSVRIGRSLRGEDLAAISTVPDRGDGATGDGRGRFAVLLPRIHEPQDAVRIAARIFETVARPLELDGQLFELSIATGIALFPWDDQEVDGLIDCADQALDRAIEDRGGVQFFSKPMNALSDDRLALEDSLRGAVERQEFVLHYQPRVDGESGQILGTEALIRWNHPRLGLMAPGGFIDVAEQSRLIIPIGNWVLEEACRQNRAWQDGGLPPIPVSVNVSAIQFRDAGFADCVARALAVSGLPGSLLELEITESVVMNDAAEAIRTMRVLKELGVRISIDDFGTGFSSLAYLKDFPVDALKVDRSFISDITRNERIASIACAVIDLGARLGLAVVGEGVETQEQRRFLLEHGCREMQGFLFARPMSAQALESHHRAGVSGTVIRSRSASVLMSAPTTVQ